MSNTKLMLENNICSIYCIFFSFVFYEYSKYCILVDKKKIQLYLLRSIQI